MSSTQKLIFLYCEENLHVGAGSSTGTIDLPIQREGHTGFPKIEGSSLRGGIRESINDSIDSTKTVAFESVLANAIAATNNRLLISLMPNCYCSLFAHIKEFLHGLHAHWYCTVSKKTT